MRYERSPSLINLAVTSRQDLVRLWPKPPPGDAGPAAGPLTLLPAPRAANTRLRRAHARAGPALAAAGGSPRLRQGNGQHGEQAVARAASGPRGQWCRPGWWAALTAAVALMAAGCGGTSPPPSASASALPKTTLTACTVDGLAARCGKVWVPQDWAHPAGPAMSLQVVVFPATATSHPAAPLFYPAGYNGDDAGFGDAVLNGMSWPWASGPRSSPSSGSPRPA
jgi:hypothetical protein